MKPGEPIPTLAWTGERMVPCQSDAATELYHWQRYLYFRPWYDGTKVVDAASGEGYGTAFAATYAETALGIDISGEAVRHATTRYPQANFDVRDVTGFDYSEADLVMSFETIEHVEDPTALLKSYGKCPGRIVISTPNRKTHSPGNSLEDKPLNSFHTIEWTPNEFAELVRSVFPDRQVRFLSQESRWPGLITEGLDDEAMYCIAVIGDGELPRWPKIGLAMPTVDNATQANDTIMHLSRFYPGELQFAICANGSSSETLEALTTIQDTLPYSVKLLTQPTNLGYGRGANAGLDWLVQQNRFDLYGVTNDDVIGTPTTLIEMVMAHKALTNSGQKVGVLGPVSDKVAGAQQVDIGSFTDLQGLLYNAEQHHLAKHSSVTEAIQVRGLFMLITPDCLAELGGFDPRYNIGNFEDDDYNVRAKLAGYSQWIVDGAFLFHHGSQTFVKLLGEESKYRACMERNQEIFQWKWDVANIEEWPLIDSAPAGVGLHIPFDATWDHEFTVNVDGTEIDLVSQASDVEFTKWMYDRLKVRHRSLRSEVVKMLLNSKLEMAVVETVEQEIAA